MDNQAENVDTTNSTPAPPKTRRKGRPRKGEGVDWPKIEAQYVTGTSSLESLADLHAVSKSAILERSAKEKWVARREAHRAQVQREAKTLIQKSQAVPIARQVEQVGALAAGVQARLAQAIAAKNVQQVECPGCGHTHAVEIPRYDVSVSDLLGLLKARSLLMGDPTYRPDVDGEDEAELRRIEGMEPEQVREEVAEILKDAESYDVG